MALRGSSLPSPAMVWEQSDVLCMAAATLGSLVWTAYSNARSTDLIKGLEADAVSTGLKIALAPSRSGLTSQDRMTMIFAWILILIIPVFTGFFLYWGFQNNLMERRYRYRNRVGMAQLLGVFLGLWMLYKAHLASLEEEERRRKRIFFKKEESYYLHPATVLLLPLGFIVLRFCPFASLTRAAGNWMARRGGRGRRNRGARTHHHQQQQQQQLGHPLR